MTEVAADPATLAHSEWLWNMAEDRSNPLSNEDRARLREISCLLKYRPDIDMTGDFQFEVGKTYPTRGGKLVRIIGKTETKGYECVQGDDMDPQTGYRYSRSTGSSDHGRCTGSPGDNPNNLLPIEIDDPRITKAVGELDLLGERAARISEWLDKQCNTTGATPEVRVAEWIDEKGFSPAEIRVARIAIRHLVGESTSDLRRMEA